eukprot:m.41934 g.41934  ORF g.41934 m.41934 type:complete len:163 (+) comp6197_c0_seq2:42-530(+)
MDGDMSTMPIIFGSVFAVFFVGIVGCGCWRKWKEGGNNYALMPAQPVVGAYQSQHSPVYPYSQGAASPQPALSGAETGPTDFFISHTQRNGAATTIATDLYSSLKEEGNLCNKPCTVNLVVVRTCCCGCEMHEVCACTGLHVQTADTCTHTAALVVLGQTLG